MRFTRVFEHLCIISAFEWRDFREMQLLPVLLNDEGHFRAPAGRIEGPERVKTVPQFKVDGGSWPRAPKMMPKCRRISSISRACSDFELSGTLEMVLHQFS